MSGKGVAHVIEQSLFSLTDFFVYCYQKEKMVLWGFYNRVDVFNKPDITAEWTLYVLEIPSCLVTV